MHVWAHWNLPPGKYIWLHYDEKWFWGFVGHRNAKMAPSAGINKSTKSAYHRSHIDKVMGIAFTGFAFDTYIENGGDGLKIGFFRWSTQMLLAPMLERPTNPSLH
jgi:hypothetical protein